MQVKFTQKSINLNFDFDELGNLSRKNIKNKFGVHFSFTEVMV